MSDANLSRSATEKSPTTELDKKLAATLSEQSWRHTGQPGHQLKEHETLTTARGEAGRIAQQNGQRTQTRQGEETPGLGPLGTDGAPPMPSIAIPDIPARRTPAPADTIPQPAPPVQRVDDTPPAGFKFNPESKTAPPVVPRGGAQTEEYDPLSRVGGRPVTLIADDVTRVGGTLMGAKFVHDYWKDQINETFSFREPKYSESKLVADATEKELEMARRGAHGFLRAQHDRIVPTVRAMQVDPAMRTDAENIVAERLQTVDWAKANTTKSMMTANGPAQKLDLKVLRDDTELQMQGNFSRLETFERAQDKLIAERTVNLTALETAQRDLHTASINEARSARFKDFSALLGAEAINLAIDNVAPRNRPGWATVIGDLAAPAVMAAPMVGLGKWAPLVKGTVIVGTHAFTHFFLDENVPDKR